MSSRNEKILELERRSTKSHTMEKSLCKRLGTYRKTLHDDDDDDDDDDEHHHHHHHHLGRSLFGHLQYP
jgi:hypothetical protein